MKTVITYGTFDLFHMGHLNLLKRARQFGDRLIVGCSTDEFNAIKGKKTLIPFEHRKAILESIRYVDMVIPEQTWEQKIDDIKKYNVDVFVIGDDWKGKFDYLRDYCEVVYLERTREVSSSYLKSLLFKFMNVDLNEVENALSTIVDFKKSLEEILDFDL